MTHAQPFDASTRRSLPLVSFRVWHLALLVLFVALAIVNIQAEGRPEPALVGLAAGGFALYGLLGWLGWHATRRLEARLGAIVRLGVYLAAMALLYFVATVVYLLIEHVYLYGGL
jgi:hypothetical protein